MPHIQKSNTPSSWKAKRPPERDKTNWSRRRVPPPSPRPHARSWRRPSTRGRLDLKAGNTAAFLPPDLRPIGPQKGPSSHTPAVRNRTFLRQRPLSRHRPPCWRPEPVSEINVAQPALSHGSATVRPWDICSATPASPPPTSSHSSRSMLSPRLVATGCSPRPPAAPAPTAQPSSNFLISSAPVTPSLSGSWIGWAGRCGTWSTPSPAWLSVASGSAASRKPSIPLPRRQACLPRLRRSS
jgi:hypothetical protein